MLVALGLGLRPSDFGRLLRDPRALALGLTGQLLVLPAVAWAMARLFGLPPHLAVGLMLIAACPGGATSNALSHLARGDVALSVSLTAVTSALSFLWVPLVLGVGLSAFALPDQRVSLDAVETARRLLVTTALPVFLGMLGLRAHPGTAARLRGPLLAVSLAVLLALIGGLGASLGGDDWGRLLRSAGPAVLALLASMTSLALLGARALRLSASQGRTLAIELGIQNFNLAMMVALSLLEERLFLGAALVYLPAMLLFAAGLVAWGRR